MFILQRSVQCLSAIVTPVAVKVFKESMNVWVNELLLLFLTNSTGYEQIKYQALTYAMIILRVLQTVRNVLTS
jgi:hypothetical protein